MPRSLFDGAGTLRSAYDGTDWASTPLGPVTGWSTALRSAVSLILDTRFPVTLLWGPESVLVYNEAYVPLIADKHPAALGSRAEEVFPEAWELIGPLLRGVLDGGPATWVRDAHVPLRRSGFLEDCYFTYSYSAVRGVGPDGRERVEGVMDVAAETTREVLDRRRLSTLADLRAELGSAHGAEAIRAAAGRVLARAADDLPDVRWDAVSAALPVADVGELTVLAPRTLHVELGPHAEAGEDQRWRLHVVLSPHLVPDDAYLGFVSLIGSSIGQAFDRIAAEQGERRVTEAQRGLAEAVQLSLLTPPPAVAGLDVAVRYRAAARQAQIGGDWYDSFAYGGGDVALVIGDVAGHDRQAAVQMAQVRSLLRGVALTGRRPASGVLQALDGVLEQLSLNVIVTTVVATATPPPPGGDGCWTWRWSNAGHPPPALLADGVARLLETEPDVVLGIDPARPRHDHEVALAPGALLVLYTDGLVERRGLDLQDGLDTLLRHLGELGGLSADEVCDALLERMVDDAEDDVALLVVRVAPGPQGHEPAAADAPRGRRDDVPSGPSAPLAITR
ncbi:MAG: PP2C family protein-serine/threonine phosphatase [Kineosporiaceae bacterium]